MKYLFLLVMLPVTTWADVIMEVTASMVAPACNVRSEDSASPLKIDFGIVNVKSLGSSGFFKVFPLYISGCNSIDNLSLIINPKGSGTLSYNGRRISGTNIDGLGVDLKEITGGIIRDININKKEHINPVKIDPSLYRIDLQAQLVNTIPAEKLKLGKFTSIITLSVTYD